MRAKFVFEDIIDRDKIELNIDFGVSRTQHAEERQDRKGYDHITDEEIKSNIKGAMEHLIDDLIFDISDIGERILIKNTESHLNIVGVPKMGQNNVLIFKLITVMRHPAFKNIKDTRIIRIKNSDLKNDI